NTKMAVQQQAKNKGPDLKILGLKSPMEVIDILALLKIDGEPIIKDERALLDPKQKAQTVMEYFQIKFNVKPNDLPYLASLIKHDLKHGKIGRREK
ncbi:MAG: hypothetical protein ABIA67_01850, partial [Candidatus Margulisiibacteriota bacterium]